MESVGRVRNISCSDSENYWLCGVGEEEECISALYVCDGVKDCQVWQSTKEKRSEFIGAVLFKDASCIRVSGVPVV